MVKTADRPSRYLTFTSPPQQAAGFCLTFWSLNCVFFTFIYTGFAVLVLPYENEQIVTVTSLYADCERSLRSMIFQAHSLPPTPDRQAVINRLASCASLLQTLEKADRLRAKFLGVPVSWGVLKTFLVTMLTLAIGLWSILRGVGVGFTLQTVCPGP